MSFAEYKVWYVSIFGREVAHGILDDGGECIRKEEKELKSFFKNYERIKPIENIESGYLIKGCNECINERIIVRKQDSPGFLGKISENDLIIIGLEANIETDIHIAYDHYESKSDNVHLLFKRLNKFFPNIKRRAYLTDIAKCRSTKLHKSRQICFKKHFLKELDILLKINPKFKLLIQGTSTEKYFKDYFDDNFDKLDDEIITKKGNKVLFRRRFINLYKKKIPVIILPHASIQNSYLWNEIEKDEILASIKLKLKEFNYITNIS